MNDIVIGSVIGRLTVINMEYRLNTQHRHIMWYLCKCSCGNTKWIQRGSIKIGKNKSCGCLQREIASARRPWNKIGTVEATKLALWNSYKSGAKKRNMEWTLTMEQFIYLVENKCYYCNAAPSNTRKGKFGDYVYNGIDRKNNNLGYTINNSVTCCKECNFAKRCMLDNDFITMASRVFNNTHNKNNLPEHAISFIEWDYADRD